MIEEDADHRVYRETLNTIAAQKAKIPSYSPGRLANQIVATEAQIAAVHNDPQLVEALRDYLTALQSEQKRRRAKAKSDKDK